MILVDTSVRVDLLERGAVLMHPLVVSEIACASLTQRSAVLELLQYLPMAEVADTDEILSFIARRHRHGQGIGPIDVHLLASTALTAGARLWTRDKRLRAADEALACDHKAAGAN